MGTLIAYEMAQQLIRQSDEVELLAVIDGHVALERKQLRPEDEAQLLAGFLNTASSIFGIKVSTSAADFQDLSKDKQTDYVLEQAEKSGLLARLGGPRQLHSYLEVFRANVEAQLAYVPTNPVRRIVVFRAQDDPRNELYDDSLGWNKLAVEPVEIYNVPGDHYSILSKPYVSVLAESLKACLDGI
jgi:thioesterase domain-containing protein